MVSVSNAAVMSRATHNVRGGVFFRLKHVPHHVAVSAFIMCSDLCACIEMFGNVCAVCEFLV